VIAGAALYTRAQEPNRPRITGISKVALYVSDLDNARLYYCGFLGYDQADPGGRTVPPAIAVRINDHQVIELIPQPRPGDRLAYLSLETDDAVALRRELASKGVAVPTDVVHSPDGTVSFRIMDPDGHVLEFAQQTVPANRSSKPFPSTRVAARLSHAGILVSSVTASLRFYHDLLGFRETWRGSRNGRELSWVNLKLPDGDDYLEFMLYSKLPPPAGRGKEHHICLEAPDVAAVEAELKSRPLPAGCKPTTELKTGVNGKRQINTYDPDGTRVEVMEPKPADGKPVPPSPAPAPHGEPLLPELLHSRAADGVPAP